MIKEAGAAVADVIIMADTAGDDLIRLVRAGDRYEIRLRNFIGEERTIAVVATDKKVSREQAHRKAKELYEMLVEDYASRD